MPDAVGVPDWASEPNRLVFCGCLVNVNRLADCDVFDVELFVSATVGLKNDTKEEV